MMLTGIARWECGASMVWSAYRTSGKRMPRRSKTMHHGCKMAKFDGRHDMRKGSTIDEIETAQLTSGKVPLENTLQRVSAS